MPVSWQMGPSFSAAISILEKMMLSACDACVLGVSATPAALMAARTSGGRLVAVWVISSRRLLSRNCMESDILSTALCPLASGQQTSSRFGEISEDKIRAGATDRGESLHHGALQIDPAIGRGRHNHRIF